jgi:coenzyme F420-reducing hydrogenase gamma subunit
MKDFRVELKICEGCGTLWLRCAGDGIYCRGCAHRLSEFPAPLMQFRRGRKRKGLALVSGAGGGR